MRRPLDFDAYYRRESKRAARTLPSGEGSEPLFHDQRLAHRKGERKLRLREAEEELRRHSLAIRRAIDDTAHLTHFEAWAKAICAASLGLGLKAAYEREVARDVVRWVAEIRTAGQLESATMRTALRLGALLEEFHLLTRWRRELVIGRKSVSQDRQGVKGRAGRRLSGRPGRAPRYDAKDLGYLRSLSRHDLKPALKALARAKNYDERNLAKAVQRARRKR